MDFNKFVLLGDLPLRPCRSETRSHFAVLSSYGGAGPTEAAAARAACCRAMWEVILFPPPLWHSVNISALLPPAQGAISLFSRAEETTAETEFPEVSLPSTRC